MENTRSPAHARTRERGKEGGTGHDVKPMQLEAKAETSVKQLVPSCALHELSRNLTCAMRIIASSNFWLAVCVAANAASIPVRSAIAARAP